MNNQTPQQPLIFNVTRIPEYLGSGFLDNRCVLFDNIDQPLQELHEKADSKGFPVKCESFFALVVLQGTIRLLINLREESVTSGQMLIMLPGCIFQHKGIDNGTQMFSVILDTEFTNVMRKSLGLRLPLLPGSYHHVVVPLTDEVLSNCLEIYMKIKTELQLPEYPVRRKVVQRYLEIMMLKTYALADNVDQQALAKPLNRKEQIFHDFLTLLEKHYTQERSISFYASRMCLTPKYLSTIIKEVSGKHGMQWIDEFVSLEAKALLRNSDLSVKQVSDQLNFPSQSMFGRFFKKMTGYSPKQYKML
ncbi:MAG: helix-turn-helix transcriptional regulator [Bacteroidaceae bacterium]|nr:helix-turn-helix transcriptional regulator [Bacteroidaceae bacterium]